MKKAQTQKKAQPGEIEKGVPLTPQLRPRGYSKYPWPEMEIGDSVRFNKPTRTKATVPRECLAAYQYGRSSGKKFTGRKQADGSYRIWRTA